MSHWLSISNVKVATLSFVIFLTTVARVAELVPVFTRLGIFVWEMFVVKEVGREGVGK